MSGPTIRSAFLLLTSLSLALIPPPPTTSAQSASIPGVSSKYNSEETIRKLVEAESIPLARMKQEQESSRRQKSAWLRLSQRMATVRDAARNLYGFQNPFNNKIATSSDPTLLTATADRSAQEQEVSIQVKQVAASDRFASRSLPKDYQVPAGIYRFRVGEREVRLNFRGGSLKELADLINSRASDLLKASIISDSKNSQVFLLESKLPGARNQLTFHDQAAAFGEQARIIERSLEASRTLAVDKPVAWEKGLEGVDISADTLILNPGAEARIPLLPPHTMKPNMVLSLEIWLRRLPEEPYKEPVPPAGPDLPQVGGIEYGGIEVQSERSLTVLPEWTPPEPPRRQDDFNILYVQEKGRLVALPPLQDSDAYLTLQYEAGQLPQEIEALGIRNRNTHRIVQVRNIRIYDKTARGEHRAVNPLSQARDAVIVMDGVEVTRESNEIDDLLAGVKLTLLASGERPVSLKVAKDLEAIKETLFNFIGFYNQLLMHIDILTRQDEEVLEGALFLKDTEKEQARQDLGLLQGNTTLMQVKSRLQRIMMDPHPTQGGRELSLLAQIGITTSGGQLQTSGVVDRTRLRGYLQIEEAKLEESLNRVGDLVRQLFGFDTDNDLVVDAGAAYQVDTYLRAYVETGGVVSTRISTLDSAIARKEREIEAFNQHLADYERELRRKFGIMEGALDTLEKSSKAIENLNRRNE